ncbi:MAG: acyl-CoA dehydrogenase [Rhodospirillaceae bacterium]|jgi:acyl-CoA dehydrogenase|nr:acyl-CoA dehydrogenase [Rhodospirillaceae bacterium]
MVDFSLTGADERILQAAREEAVIGHRHARYYDKHEDELPPPIFPEVADKQSPHDLALELKDQTSGPAIIDVLLHLEESYADTRLRRTRTGLGQMIVNYAGTPEQIARFGRKELSIALTEPGAGSDPAAIRGTAARDSQTGEWILNGEKIYCSGFGGADGVLVLVRGPAENGVRPFMAFVVEKGAPGLKMLGQVKKMGIRSWDTEDFVLQDCRVPDFNRIDADFKKTMIVFNGTRPMVAAFGLGVARALLDFTREKLGEQGIAVRYESGSAQRSATQDRLLRLEALYDAALLTILRCKWLEDRDGRHSGATKVEASVAKAIGGKAARRISQECLELLGPLALSEDFLAEKWFRDARIFDIFEGAGEINRLIVARWLLGYSAKELA